jgi:GNAT superfamily N-acetyltransferase
MFFRICGSERFALVPIADSRYEIRKFVPIVFPFGFSRGHSARSAKTAMKGGNAMSGTEIIYGGYSPGVVGRITEIHALYYHEHWNFDISFETQVGRELSEFLRDFRDGKDFFRTAMVGGRFAGSIAITGKDAASEGARLRWYIVTPEFQGLGIGRRLIHEAVGFCREAGYRRVYLWTFKGLDRARALYELEGFRLTAEHDVVQWGNKITEQMFALELKH